MKNYPLIWAVIAALALAGCKKTEEEATLTDSSAPTLSDSALTLSDASSDSIKLSWTAASDDQDPSNQLTYRAYYSSSSNLDSLSNTETNGTAVGDATADITSVTIAGLSTAQTYYFNVVAADTQGNQTAYTQTSGATVDTTAPTPGGSATLTSSNVGTSSATLSWTAATDDITAASELLYQVYSSSSNNLSGLTDAQTNGTVVQAWTANLASVTPTLTAGTSTYFSVLVKDTAGNMGRYNTLRIDANSSLVLFEVLNLDGNLGGRSGLDATCASTRSANFSSLSCAQVRGFISVSATDEIQDMPGNYAVPTDLPITGSTGTQIATNWADLLDGALSQDLSTAGINSSSSGWFSGSDAGGAVHANTCNGWTFNTDYTYYGRGGWKNATDATWISQNNFACQFASYSALCLCY
ncbi:MAG: fibronectin type III domain-containing protein [bacterium]|nr:fibronectin type III domain-containing protein [bacterium]